MKHAKERELTETKLAAVANVQRVIGNEKRVVINWTIEKMLEGKMYNKCTVYDRR